MLLKSLKTLLGFGLLGFVGVWIGCSSDASPVAPHPAGKTHLTLTSPTDSDGDGIPDADSTQTDADADGDGIPDADSTQTYVTFADSSLERAVGEALVGAFIFPQVPTRGSITVANMRRLTKLEANSRGIKSLTGLENAVNLDTLYLEGNSITDLNPLASLTKLKRLVLVRNSIADVSPLGNLTNLEELRLYINSITDVTPLTNLTNLKKLGVGANEFGGDLSLFSSLTNLEWLKVNDTGVTDVSPLTSLTKLKWLNLSSNRISDLSPLTCLPELETLRLRNAFTDADDGQRTRIGETNHHIIYLKAEGVTIQWE